MSRCETPLPLLSRGLCQWDTEEEEEQLFIPAEDEDEYVLSVETGKNATGEDDDDDEEQLQ